MSRFGPSNALANSGLIRTSSDTAIMERMASDPRFFIETFFWIVDKTSRKIPFLFNPPQEKYYRERTRNDLILKSRKEGFSTLIEALWLYDAMFLPNQRTVTLAQNEDEMAIHRDRIQFFLDTMSMGDIPFTVEVDKDNQKEIFFPATESYVWVGGAGSRTFGRSRDFTHFHGTEVAHYENQDVLTGAMNACIQTAWQALETTANGLGEAFNLMWDEAVDPRSGSVWKTHFFAWWEDPTNTRAVPDGFILDQREKDIRSKHKLTMEQMAWRRWKYHQQADKAKFPQEFPATPEEAFISSGRHVFDIPALKNMLANTTPPIWVGDVADDGRVVDFVQNDEGALSIWKKPRPGRYYFIPADIAEGVKNGCYSVATVFDRSSWEVVAELRERCMPGQFGRRMVDLGVYYNNAVLCPELNNHGHATIEAILAEKYQHLLETKTVFPDSAKAHNGAYGFPTDERSKELIHNTLGRAIVEQSYFDPSRVAVLEMHRTVRDDAGRIKGESGYQDCVISRAIGVFCLKFLTIDDTYRNPMDNPANKAMTTTSVAGPRHVFKQKIQPKRRAML